MSEWVWRLSNDGFIQRIIHEIHKFTCVVHYCVVHTLWFAICHRSSEMKCCHLFFTYFIRIFYVSPKNLLSKPKKRSVNVCVRVIFFLSFSISVYNMIFMVFVYCLLLWLCLYYSVCVYAWIFIWWSRRHSFHSDSIRYRGFFFIS